MAFKVCKKGTCGVTITDLNELEYQSTPLFSASSNINYLFTECASVNALISITYDNERKIQAFDITTHYTSVNDETDEVINVTDESELQFGVDGLYEVTHMILPTKTYLIRYADKDFSTIFPNGVYFVDEGKIYKYGETLEEIEIEVLTEINTTGTSIFKELKNTFSLCHLQECFYNLCKLLLSNLCGCKKDCNKANTYAKDIFNRDLIWMAINTIKYAIEQGQYFEAQRILESIAGCGDICSQFDSENNTNRLGCGCNR